MIDDKHGEVLVPRQMAQARRFILPEPHCQTSARIEQIDAAQWLCTCMRERIHDQTRFRATSPYLSYQSFQQLVNERPRRVHTIDYLKPAAPTSGIIAVTSENNQNSNLKKPHNKKLHDIWVRLE